MLMKPLAIALICLSSLAAKAQEIVFASAEPLAFHEKINLSLSGDNVKDALTTFKNLIAYYKSTHQYDQLPESYFGMALALALNGNYRESIHYHKLAMRAHKKLNKQEAVEMNINLGLTYKLAGKEKKAQRILGDFHLGT
jgi:hypothetical protein